MIRHLCAALPCLAVTVLPSSPSLADGPALSLITAARTVVVDRYASSPGVQLGLGAYLAANAPFEIRVKRSSYDRPIEARRRIGGREERLPPGLLKDFSGLPGFLDIRIKDPRGRTVKRISQKFCPNGMAGRVRSDAAPVNRYPESCALHPFTLGSVWGIQRGWAVSTLPYDAPYVDLKPGRYDVEMTVAERYQRLLDASGATRKVRLVVRKAREQAERRGSALSGTAQAPRERPSGTPAAPGGPRPDLRALPAWGIRVSHENDAGKVVKKRDYLRFAATVWNAGPSRLVVDGFRREGRDVMDAYQYFYGADGAQKGFVKTGGFEWDPKPGHQHWHFTDFAAYRLLSADKRRVVRGQKEAFCLANTDQIDLTVPGAIWRPDNTDLSTSCGEATSVSVRQVLEAGSGDTYESSLPGQSFDVTGLPNGVYLLEVAANPARHLVESTFSNNVAYRRIVLGGGRGARTVKITPVGSVRG